MTHSLPEDDNRPSEAALPPAVPTDDAVLVPPALNDPFPPPAVEAPTEDEHPVQSPWNVRDPEPTPPVPSPENGPHGAAQGDLLHGGGGYAGEVGQGKGYALKYDAPGTPSEGVSFEGTDTDKSGRKALRNRLLGLVAAIVVLILILVGFGLFFAGKDSNSRAAASKTVCMQFGTASTMKTLASNSVISGTGAYAHQKDMEARQQLLLASVDRQLLASADKNVREAITDYLDRAQAVLFLTARNDRVSADVQGMNAAAKKANLACGYSEDGNPPFGGKGSDSKPRP